MNDKNCSISLKDIGVTYNSGGKNSVNAIEDINLEIKSREFIAVLGPSGCGKSTLLNILAGFVKPTRGTALMNGKPITAPSFERGVVFQTPILYPWLSVMENVEFGLKMRKFDKKERLRLCEKYLKEVELLEFKNYKSYELSGGMRQRAALARALAGTPSIILLDEPFGALDAFTKINMQILTRMIWAGGKSTFFLITHDVDEALSLATRVIVMSKRPGRILKEFDVEFTYRINETVLDKTRFSKEYISLREEILSLIHHQTSDASGYII
ncbi:MAG: ABC transporter ATP-binding protein [Campylobacteraceae bacterium]|jgi:taurine transport system ATP-binding protein|nr:ABC transporter ATP-binding protein [Campylobacteraceae bacterium]